MGNSSPLFVNKQLVQKQLPNIRLKPKIYCTRSNRSSKGTNAFFFNVLLCALIHSLRLFFFHSFLSSFLVSSLTPVKKRASFFNYFSASFCLLSTYSQHISYINWKNCRCCARESNPGQSVVGADAPTELWRPPLSGLHSFFCSLTIHFNCGLVFCTQELTFLIDLHLILCESERERENKCKWD